ncbi:MAG: valine--tRNA ligase [Acidimicrobiia bacterium]
MPAPEKPSLDGLEEKWSTRWETEGTYRFDRSKTRDEIFSIDTPPPTVSGSLHMGSMFGYVQTDGIARFQRMRGREVFYPMGWDDNGLPTERRVQNYFGVRCDPSLPYDPDFTPPEGAGKSKQPISMPRRNFVELCERLTVEDEQAFEHVWRAAGLSVDWSLTYTSIGPHAQRVSQRAFLRNLARGEAYQAEAPTLWDVDFRTAVAQAELEDREIPGAYHAVRFAGIDGAADIVIETTRPELIPSCVALVAHPDDERYRARFGQTVTSPLFGAAVPVLAHPLADPEKGSGIAMICTFGDTTDVVWWRELGLPIRPSLGWDGRMRTEPPLLDGERWSTSALDAYGELAGKTVKQAQARIVELLRDAADLVGEPKPITHPVKFYENGDRPLEIVTTRQWYFVNGARDEALRAAMHERGEALVWHPPHMRVRYQHWVDGLNGDWLVSRQRFFGVPFPIWYRLDENGEPDYEHPLVPSEDELPVDPSSDAPSGYAEELRGKPNGFMGDPDVMDTWGTSSLTPQVAGGWIDDPDLWERVFPMDLRPQGPEIIRTWLFDTVLRSHLEHDALPWAHTSINGWILDPDRKKMSKSKGNVVTPLDLVHQYGPDAVRYWALIARPGVDTAYDEGQMKIGRRLAIKILNASKFALGVMGDDVTDVDAVDAPLDVAMLGALRSVVVDATRAFDDFDYARALDLTERFFWAFCDDYLELVKQRAYGGRGDGGAGSARAALRAALSVLLRLFSPHLPFVSEEVWSWWRDGSVHRTAWPAPDELGVGDMSAATYTAAAAVVGEIRKAKSSAQRSMRTEVTRLVVRAPQGTLDALGSALDDVKDAGRVVGDVELVVADELTVDARLADPEAA